MCIHKRTGSEYTALVSILDTNNSIHAELLSKLKKRLRTETFTADYILDIINHYPELVRTLYLTFANSHYVQTRGEQDDFLPTLSYLRLKVDRILDDSELGEVISKTVANEHHEMVMTAFRIFNHSVLYVICFDMEFFTIADNSPEKPTSIPLPRSR